MIIEKLIQKKDEIEERIKKLTQERDEIVRQIEESSIDDEQEIELTTKNENSNSFIQIFISIMSFVGIIAGVIYVIHFKKEGLG